MFSYTQKIFSMLKTGKLKKTFQILKNMQKCNRMGNNNASLKVAGVFGMSKNKAYELCRSVSME